MPPAATRAPQRPPVALHAVSRTAPAGKEQPYKVIGAGLRTPGLGAGSGGRRQGLHLICAG